MRLIVQPGIRKPAELSAALTIPTAYAPPGGQAPYDDELGVGGNLRYKWRGTDPRHADNQALREAMHRRVPLACFYPIANGVYEAIYPVYLVDEDPQRHEFAVEFAENLDDVAPMESAAERRYTRQLTLRRLQQIVFRPKVLRAYDSRCTMCRLRHAPLLDAAHTSFPSDRQYAGIRSPERPRDVQDPRRCVRYQHHRDPAGPRRRGPPRRPHRDRRADAAPRPAGDARRANPAAWSRYDHPDPTRLEERWEQFLAA
jgi:hypothetical protein